MEPSPQPAPRIPVRTMAQDLERAVRARQGQAPKQAPPKQTKEPERLTLRSLEAQEEDILAPYRQKKSSLQEQLEKEGGQIATPAFGMTRIMTRPAPYGAGPRPAVVRDQIGPNPAVPPQNRGAGESNPPFIPPVPAPDIPAAGENRQDDTEKPYQKTGGNIPAILPLPKIDRAPRAPLPPPPIPAYAPPTPQPSRNASAGTAKTTAEKPINLEGGYSLVSPEGQKQSIQNHPDLHAKIDGIRKTIKEGLPAFTKASSFAPPSPKATDGRSEATADKLADRPVATLRQDRNEGLPRPTPLSPPVPPRPAAVRQQTDQRRPRPAYNEAMANEPSVKEGGALPHIQKTITHNLLPIEEEEMEAQRPSSGPPTPELRRAGKTMEGMPSVSEREGGHALDKAFTYAPPAPRVSYGRSETSADKPAGRPAPAASESASKMPQVPETQSAYASAKGGFASNEEATADKPSKNEEKEKAPYRPAQSAGPRPSLQEEISIALRQMLAKQTPVSSAPASPKTSDFEKPESLKEKSQIEIRPPVKTPEEILGLGRRVPYRGGESGAEPMRGGFGEAGYRTVLGEDRPVIQRQNAAPVQDARIDAATPLAWNPPSESLGREAQQTPPPLAEGPFEPSLTIESSRDGLRALLRIGIFILGATIILGGMGGFVYWQIFRQEEPPPQAPGRQEQPPQIPRTPTPFFSVSWQQTVQIPFGEPAGQEQTLRQLLEQTSEQAHPAETIGFLRLQKSTGEFLTSREFLGAMGIVLPDALANSFNENQFMLYMYIPGEEESLRCEAAQITDPGCSTGRLGVIFKLRAGREERAQTEMENFQSQLVQAASSIILGSPALEDPYEWKTATYRGVKIYYPAGIAVRYANLPLSTTALNYAFAKGYLVLATSKNSSYAAIDELLQVVDPQGIQ